MNDNKKAYEDIKNLYSQVISKISLPQSQPLQPVQEPLVKQPSYASELL